MQQVARVGACVLASAIAADGDASLSLLQVKATKKEVAKPSHTSNGTKVNASAAATVCEAPELETAMQNRKAMKHYVSCLYTQCEDASAALLANQDCAALSKAGGCDGEEQLQRGVKGLCPHSCGLCKSSEKVVLLDGEQIPMPMQSFDYLPGQAQMPTSSLLASGQLQDPLAPAVEAKPAPAVIDPMAGQRMAALNDLKSEMDALKSTLAAAPAPASGQPSAEVQAVQEEMAALREELNGHHDDHWDVDNVRQDISNLRSRLHGSHSSYWDDDEMAWQIHEDLRDIRNRMSYHRDYAYDGWGGYPYDNGYYNTYGYPGYHHVVYHQPHKIQVHLDGDALRSAMAGSGEGADGAGDGAGAGEGAAGDAGAGDAGAADAGAGLGNESMAEGAADAGAGNETAAGDALGADGALNETAADAGAGAQRH